MAEGGAEGLDAGDVFGEWCAAGFDFDAAEALVEGGGHVVGEMGRGVVVAIHAGGAVDGDGGIFDF